MAPLISMRRLSILGASSSGWGWLLRRIREAAKQAGPYWSRMTVAPPGLHKRLLDELDSELQVLMERKVSTINQQQVRKLISGAAARQVNPNAVRRPLVAEKAAEEWLAATVVGRYIANDNPMQVEDPNYDISLLRAALFDLREDRDKADVLEKRAFEQRLSSVDFSWEASEPD